MKLPSLGFSLAFCAAQLQTQRNEEREVATSLNVFGPSICTAPHGRMETAHRGEQQPHRSPHDPQEIRTGLSIKTGVSIKQPKEYSRFYLNQTIFQQ